MTISGLARIQHAVDHQLHVDVVQAHRPVVRPAHAAEHQLIPLGRRLVDVPKALGGFADGPDQLARVLLDLVGMGG